MLSALADGRSEITGCLMGEDVLSTMNAFRSLGVTIKETAPGVLAVEGVGVDGLLCPQKELDLGNSGTSMRLMCGILAGAGIGATLTGDASLSRRPMRRVIRPIEQMGGRIESSSGTPPLHLKPVARLHAIDYALPVASAQVKSAVLLAGLFADGTTCVRESVATRDHTERMLGSFGVKIESGDGWCAIRGRQRLEAVNLRVPSDISSAAFFLVGASFSAGSELQIKQVGVNPTRTGVLEILRAMGARIEVTREGFCGTEPVADLIVGAGQLRGIDIPSSLVPSAIDEFPALFVAAAGAEGVTRLRGAEELRHKESDRIAVMAEGLGALGIECRVLPDGIEIRGGSLQGGRVNAQGDHRVAMAFAIAALRAKGPVTIDNAAAIATSFPGFAELAREVGLRIGS